MRLLLAHNYYQLQGGEDLSFEAEADLLEAEGHEVVRYVVHNRDLAGRSGLANAVDAVWNRRVAAEFAELLSRTRPQVAHFHNTFPRLSPAAFYAARRAGAAVVETVQNYRLLCANALLYRDGQVCEECVGLRAPWRGVLHACYRDSRLASAAVAAVLGLHRAMRTWERAVDVFVAPSRFTALRLAALGLREGAIAHKVNFLAPDPGARAGRGGYVLFVGRLSPEKGLLTLLAAWRSLGAAVPLKVVGTGPLAEELARAAVPGVELLGRRDAAEVVALIGSAELLVVPSLWYEGLPRVVVESYACGTPVLASRIGALEEVVHHGTTGLLFRAGDAVDLAAAVRQAIADPSELAAMRSAARAEFESTYTAELNYRQLVAIYDAAIARRVSLP